MHCSSSGGCSRRARARRRPCSRGRLGSARTARARRRRGSSSRATPPCAWRGRRRFGCAASTFDCLALVKPQFEVGRERVGKGGVVRSVDDRRAALVEVAQLLEEGGWSVLGFAASGLPGPAGNLETFVWVGEPGRDGA